jgi:hypothetical protein
MFKPKGLARGAFFVKKKEEFTQRVDSKQEI